MQICVYVINIKFSIFLQETIMSTILINDDDKFFTIIKIFMRSWIFNFHVNVVQ